MESVWQPFVALRGEIDRLFDHVWRASGSGGAPRPASGEPQPLWRFERSFGLAASAIDVVEQDGQDRVTVELPGMEAKDAELPVSDDVLTIRGEKRDEREEKTETYHVTERRFGAFQRSFQRPRSVDRDRIEARFDRGVLQVTLPKTAEAAARQRKIETRPG